MTPVYVSFHTGPGYAAEAEQLVATLDAFGLDHDVRAVDDAGTWTANCARKAAYLLTMRQAHPCRPLVWVDADARVRRRPILLEAMACDVAFVRREKVELLTGTLYIGPTESAGDLLEAWREACTSRPHEWDQIVLDDVLKAHPGRWWVTQLPPAYTAIFDAGMCSEPVIEHMQASRRLRR